VTRPPGPGTRHSKGATSAPVGRLGTRARVLIALGPVGLSILIAVLYLQVAISPTSIAQPFTDATTYQAAGERLNAGEALYALQPGDRQVVILPWISNAPLLSPPLIAVLWRPLTVLPFGYALWITACWAALLGTTFLLVFRTGLLGAILAAILAPAIGEQLAEGNVAAFFPLLMALAWKMRDRPFAGSIVGLLTSVKLTPGTLVGWLVGSRRWSAVAGSMISLGVIAVVSLVGSSVAAFGDYLNVAATARPSIASLSGLTGIAWLSPGVLVAGTLAAASLGRWPRAAFVVAVSASVIGTPALYLSGWVTMLAALAPFADGTPAASKRRVRAT
jgi:Glycosyltransferase family 87